MSDHVWHRGIWFAIKLVNGSNFWEEMPPFGAETASDPNCEVRDRDHVRLLHQVHWDSEATGVLIDERRQITFGAGMIDWSCALRKTGSDARPNAVHYLGRIWRTFISCGARAA